MLDVPCNRSQLLRQTDSGGPRNKNSNQIVCAHTRPSEREAWENSAHRNKTTWRLPGHRRTPPSRPNQQKGDESIRPSYLPFSLPSFLPFVRRREAVSCRWVATTLTTSIRRRNEKIITHIVPFFYYFFFEDRKTKK